MAYVLSSVSGNLISAASAGFAPTNSADVSAIASAYQVVSATATQLYAGTAYVTSVNDSPISASRAGQAANASMANSAYYDGTGRLISALPDEAAVSSIASAYAESAASSKQDTLTFGYNTADQISSIDGSALGGMDEAAVSAIASAYAESAASGKQDTLTFGYDADNKISSIDGSAIAGGEQVVTSLQYTTSQSGAIVGYTTGDRAGGGEKVFSARYYPNKGWYNYQSSTALASVGVTSWDSYITGNTEYPFEIFMIPYGAADYGNINYISSVGSYMSNYGQFNNTSDFRIATGMATLSGYSAILDFNVTSLPFNTQHGSPMWGTGGGMVLEDSVNSLPVFAVVFGSGSDREGRCARITDGPKALGFGAITTVSAVSGINELGIAGGAGGGEADWSAESGQPGYIENKPVPKTLVAGAGITITENSTELVVASTNTLYNAGSGLSLNGTTFSVDTATVQGKITYDYDASGNISGIDGSSLVGGDPEAADLYVQSPLYTGVSGGSAYIGSRINQTVLWTGTGTTTGGTITLSESLANFERYGMYYYIPYQESGQTYYQEMVYKSGQTTFGIKTDGITNTLWRQYIDYGTMNETSISIVSGRQGGFWLTGTDRSFNLYDGNERHHYFTKVVGINRTAGE